MKKLFAAAAAIALCASLAACGGSGEEQPSAAPTATPDHTSAPLSAEEAVSSEVFETPVETESIIGTWVNDEDSVSITFNDDGTYVNDSIEGDYTLNENTLTLTYYGGEVTEDYSIGFIGDELVLVRDDLQLIFVKSE